MTKEATQILGNQNMLEGGVVKVGGLIQSLINIPSRLGGYAVGNGLDVGLGNLIGRQKDAYMDMLISHIVDPKKVTETQAILEATKPITYAISQTFARGGVDGVANLIETTSRTDKLREERAEIRAQEEAEAQPPTDNLQGAMQSFEVPQIDQPLFEQPELNPMEVMSPTILPNEKDREIALRNSGIARLV